MYIHNLLCLYLYICTFIPNVFTLFNPLLGWWLLGGKKIILFWGESSSTGNPVSKQSISWNCEIWDPLKRVRGWSYHAENDGIAIGHIPSFHHGTNVVVWENWIRSSPKWTHSDQCESWYVLFSILSVLITYVQTNSNDAWGRGPEERFVLMNLSW